MFNKLIDILLYAGVGKKGYQRIRKNFIGGNRKNIRIVSTIASFFLFTMYILSFFNSTVEVNRTNYFAALIVMLILVAETTIFEKKIEWLLLPSIYIFMGILFLFGIGLGIADPNRTTSSFYVLLMAAPLVFYDRPIRVNVWLLFFGGVNVAMTLLYKSPTVWTTDVINGIIYCLLSCAVNTCIMVNKAEKVLYADRVTELSETDLLTEIKNRNCYEQRLEHYGERAKQGITCVYADVNGLHELNNTKGHKAGDIMLKTVAKEMRNIFGEEDTYRLGGDEFLAFALDWTEEDCNRALEKLKNRLEAEHYVVSFGVKSAEVKNINMEKLVLEAEQLMYQEKKKYYECR